MPNLDVHPKAQAYIREHGGELYIWVTDAGAFGRLRVTPEPPISGERTFNRVPGEGIVIYVDQAIKPPESWTLVYRPFPLRRVEALWNGLVYTDDSGGGGVS